MSFRWRIAGHAVVFVLVRSAPRFGRIFLLRNVITRRQVLLRRTLHFCWAAGAFDVRLSHHLHELIEMLRWQTEPSSSQRYSAVDSNEEIAATAQVGGIRPTNQPN